RRRDLLATRMTDRALDLAMEGQAHVAVLAADRFAAGRAPQRGREAAPVEEQDRLLLPGEGLREQEREALREQQRPAPFGLLGAQVDDLDARQTSAADALAQQDALVETLARVVPALERGRRRAEDAHRGQRTR